MRVLFPVLFFTFISSAFAQPPNGYSNEPSAANPYGKVNPKAPQQTKDFTSMIGVSECSSSNRNPDGTWNDPVSMQWKFRYIMDGMAVQDETLKSDGKHSGSIRQYNADSSRWYVHYYTSATATPRLSAWEGNMEEGKIILKMPQAAPNGMEGFSRLTFYEITPKSFKWVGEWIKKDETIVYPFWKIECRKVN